MRILTETGAPAWHPAPQKVVEVGQQVAYYCRSRGRDIAELALQFALQYPYVATTLVGMSQVREVELNLNSMGAPPDSDLLADVQAMIKPVANIAWREGRPENYAPNAVEKQL